MFLLVVIVMTGLMFGKGEAWKLFLQIFCPYSFKLPQFHVILAELNLQSTKAHNILYLVS